MVHEAGAPNTALDHTLGRIIDGEIFNGKGIQHVGLWPD
jgi:hypothetical protein